MDLKETKTEEQIREVSEKFNPYHPDCKNKQLWSEGFRAGVKHVTEWKYFDNISQKPEFDKSVLVKSYIGRIVTNDNKEKYQSFEANVNQDGNTGMGHYDASFTGYGANEYEAKQNIIEQIDNLIKK